MSDEIIYSLSFDPGSTHVGVVYISYNRKEKKILSLETKHLKMSSGLDKNVVKLHGSLFARLELLKKNLYEFIGNKEITIASTEGAFLNFKRPNAAIPIANSIYAITNVLYDIKPEIPLKWLAASLVKNAVGVKGNVGKELIKDGVVKALLEFGYTADLSNCTEHEIDAIAVNIARLRALH